MFSNTRIRLLRLSAPISNDSNIDPKTFTLGGMAYVLASGAFQQIPSNRCHVGRRMQRLRRLRRERRFIVLIYTIITKCSIFKMKKFRCNNTEAKLNIERLKKKTCVYTSA